MVWKDIPKDESSKLSSALEAVRLPIYIRLSGFGVAVGVVPVRVSDGSSKRVPELPESFSRGGVCRSWEPGLFFGGTRFVKQVLGIRFRISSGTKSLA